MGPLFGIINFVVSLATNILFAIAIFVPLGIYYGNAELEKYAHALMWAPPMVLWGTVLMFSYLYLSNDYCDFD